MRVAESSVVEKEGSFCGSRISLADALAIAGGETDDSFSNVTVAVFGLSAASEDGVTEMFVIFPLLANVSIIASQSL